MIYDIYNSLIYPNRLRCLTYTSTNNSAEDGDETTAASFLSSPLSLHSIV